MRRKLFEGVTIAEEDVINSPKKMFELAETTGSPLFVSDGSTTEGVLLTVEQYQALLKENSNSLKSLNT